MRQKRSNRLKPSLAVALIVTLIAGHFYALATSPRASAAGTHAGPGGISENLVLWLKADDGAAADGEGNLTGWQDLTEINEFTLTVPAGSPGVTPQYAASAVNFNPAVQFNNPNSANHMNNSGRLVGDQQVTFQSGYAVTKQTRGAMVGSAEIQDYGAIVMGSYSGQFAIGTGIRGNYRYLNGLGGNYDLVGYEIGTEVIHQGSIDGTPVVPSRSDRHFEPIQITPVVGATAGTSTDNWPGFTGEIAEIIWFDDTLDAANHAKIQSYLAIKYGITLDQGQADYVDSEGGIVWSADENYAHRITGIGRDDASGLLQKQSRSQHAGALVTIALGGEIATSNAANPASIGNDLSFLTFGDNGGSPNYSESATDHNGHELQRMERIYKVQKTGWQNADITLQLAESALASNRTHYLAVSLTEEFDSVDLYALDGGAVTLGSEALSDGAYFTFARVDKDALQSYVTGLESANPEQSMYEAQSWQDYEDALTAAQDVLADPNATQEEVDNALSALTAAYEALALKPAGLIGLDIVEDGNAIALAPPFDRGILGYGAVVPNAVTEIGLAPQAFDPSAAITVTLNGAKVDDEADWENLPLEEGLNIIEVEVVNPDDEPVIYTVEIIRATGKLEDLISSSGTLNPAFDSTEEEYALEVGNQVSEMTLTPTAIDPGATIAISVNGGAPIPVVSGEESAALPLSVGSNELIVSIIDSAGNTKEYMLTVTRAGGGGTGGGYIPPSSDSTETIVVDVVIGGDNEADIAKVEIKRTTHSDGRITDHVEFSPDKAAETVEKAEATGQSVARIVIPDPDDKVSEHNITVPRASLAILQEHGIDLEIYTDHGYIRIPHTSLAGWDEDVYFRLVPVRDPDERNEVEERARTEQIVRELAGDDDIEVVTRPMTIETNLQSREVVLVLPLRDVSLPEAGAVRDAYLNELSIFIVHSDGELEIVKGDPIVMNNGEWGLQFSIDRFSTFTIIHVAGDEEAVVADGRHRSYISGYPDGSFRPERSITRAELAAILVRIGATGTATGTGFPDVSADHWAAGSIARVQAAGLMIGYPDGSFRPNQPITRAEMAALVSRYLELSAADGEAYPDVPDGHWAYGVIAALAADGWLSGYPDGSFRPGRELTRAEAVTLINRMLGRGPLHGVPQPSWPDVQTSHWAYRHIEEASRDHDYIVLPDGGEQWVGP